MRGPLSGAALLLLCASLWLGQAADAAEPIVEYARAASSVVLRYQEILPVRGPDPGPSLTVYGDGRALVHFPLYMKRAGDWELQLDAAELDALIRGVAAAGVLEFDEASAGAKLAIARRARAAGGQARASSDETTVKLELRLERYKPEGAAERSGVDKRVSFAGLRFAAQEHGSVAEIRGLDEARKLCEAVMAREDLEPMR